MFSSQRALQAQGSHARRSRWDTGCAGDTAGGGPGPRSEESEVCVGWGGADLKEPSPGRVVSAVGSELCVPGPQRRTALARPWGSSGPVRPQGAEAPAAGAARGWGAGPSGGLGGDGRGGGRGAGLCHTSTGRHARDGPTRLAGPRHPVPPFLAV